MKIHIFGASGSGVTTLGQALSRKLSLPYFDSDDYFWKQTDPPFTQRHLPTDRNRAMINDLADPESWILGGSVINWGENLFPPFDLVVFLYLPADIRLDRLRKREEGRYGELIYTDAERQYQFNQFMAWARDYEYSSGVANRTLQAHEAWLAASRQPVLRLDGDLTIRERINAVMAELHSKNLLPL